MSSETTSDLDQQRRELEAQLARVEQAERDRAEQERLRQQAEQDAMLDPEMRAQKDEIERKAAEALDREFPPAWLPQKHKDHPRMVVGIVLRIDPRVGPSKTFGTYSAVIELRATDGREWTIWANESGALYAQLLRLRIQPGEVIGCRYNGMKESAANPGQNYHDFRLARVDDQDTGPQPVDYEALQRGHDTPALPAPETAPAPVDDDIPF